MSHRFQKCLTRWLTFHNTQLENLNNKKVWPKPQSVQSSLPYSCTVALSVAHLMPCIPVVCWGLIAYKTFWFVVIFSGLFLDQVVAYQSVAADVVITIRGCWYGNHCQRLLMWSLLSEAVGMVITVRGCWCGQYCQRLLVWSLLSEVVGMVIATRGFGRVSTVRWCGHNYEVVDMVITIRGSGCMVITIRGSGCMVITIGGSGCMVTTIRGSGCMVITIRGSGCMVITIRGSGCMSLQSEDLVIWS